MTEISLRVEAKNGTTPATITIDELIIAGWTGRDRAAMEAHIRELEELGVSRPSSTPMYYRISPDRLTTASRINATGNSSSGEIEFVLFAVDGRLLVGAGSDHTDRKVEAYGVTVSKQMCDKPIAATAWPWEEVADHWNELILRSHIVVDGQRHVYQEGRTDILLPPDQLIRGVTDSGQLPDGTALFGGTSPARGGVRPADRFEGELEDPVLGRRIRFGYDIRPLPIVE